MDYQAITSNPARSSVTGYAAPSAGGGSASANVKVVSSTPSAAVRVQGPPAFVSPKGVVDAESGVFILQYRNQETGEVRVEYPSKKVVSAYQNAVVATAPSESAPSKGHAQAPGKGHAQAPGHEGVSASVSADVGKSETVA